MDISKADNKSLTLLVVEKKKYLKVSPSSWLANYLFQIENLYKGSSIKVLKNMDPKLLKLDNILDIY